MDDADSAAEDRVGEAGIRTSGYEKKVPQPLRTSLSLRNTRFRNHDEYFGAGFGEGGDGIGRQG